MIILFCVYQSFSQKKPEHKAKNYTNSEGKLFWQKKMPMYLFVSPSPDKADAVRLKNDKSEYADPMYLDTEGVNFIRSKWAMDENGQYLEPMQEVLFEVYADGIAPKTTVKFENAPKFTNTSSVIFYGENLTISTSAKDWVSQVENTWFSEFPKDYQVYNGPIAMDKEGSYKMSFYSVDNVGNAEEDLNYEFVIDLNSPESNLSVSVEGAFLENIISVRARLSLLSQDQLSGVSSMYYHFDDGSAKKYYNKVNFESLPEGEHSMIYYAIDNVKNKEQEKTFEFFYDKSPPEVTSVVLGDQFKLGEKTYVSGRSKIQLTAIDNKAGVDEVFYEIGSNEQKTYSEPFLIGKSDGSYKLLAYATDKVGNSYNEKDRVSKCTKGPYYLDMTPPVLSNDLIGKTYYTRDTTFITNETLIKLNAIDKASGLQKITYTINDGESKLYSDPFTIPEEGYYKISYEGTDQVNNAASHEFYVFVDKTGPVINYTVSMDPIGNIDFDEKSESIKVYTIGTKLYLAATDAIIDTESIYYRFDKGTLMKYSKPIVLGQKGLVNIEVTSFDYLKNEATDKYKIELFIK